MSLPGRYKLQMAEVERTSSMTLSVAINVSLSYVAIQIRSRLNRIINAAYFILFLVTAYHAWPYAFKLSPVIYCQGK